MTTQKSVNPLLNILLNKLLSYFRLERQVLQGVSYPQRFDSQPNPLRVVRDRWRHEQYALPGGC